MRQYTEMGSMWAFCATVCGADEGADTKPHSKSTLGGLADCMISSPIEGVCNA